MGIQNRNLDFHRKSRPTDSMDSEKTGKSSCPTDFTDDTDSKVSIGSKAGTDSEEAPRFRFPYGSQCGIYNLQVLNLLISAPFQHQPPALILWELPYEQRHLTASLLRQLVAQVNNGCESSPALEHSEKTFQGKKLEDLVFTNRLLKTHPSNLIVDLKLSDPAIEQLLFTIWYSDGGKSDFQIRKNTLSDNHGRFSFVLGNTSTQQQRFFVALDLSLMGSANGNITVSTNVCRLPGKLLQKTEI